MEESLKENFKRLIVPFANKEGWIERKFKWRWKFKIKDVGSDKRRKVNYELLEFDGLGLLLETILYDTRWKRKRWRRKLVERFTYMAIVYELELRIWLNHKLKKRYKKKWVKSILRKEPPDKVPPDKVEEIKEIVVEDKSKEKNKPWINIVIGGIQSKEKWFVKRIGRKKEKKIYSGCEI